MFFIFISTKCNSVVTVPFLFSEFNVFQNQMDDTALITFTGEDRDGLGPVTFKLVGSNLCWNIR